MKLENAVVKKFWLLTLSQLHPFQLELSLTTFHDYNMLYILASGTQGLKMSLLH